MGQAQGTSLWCQGQQQPQHSTGSMAFGEGVATVCASACHAAPYVAPWLTHPAIQSHDMHARMQLGISCYVNVLALMHCCMQGHPLVVQGWQRTWVLLSDQHDRQATNEYPVQLLPTKSQQAHHACDQASHGSQSSLASSSCASCTPRQNHCFMQHRSWKGNPCDCTMHVYPHARVSSPAIRAARCC